MNEHLNGIIESKQNEVEVTWMLLLQQPHKYEEVLGQYVKK